MKKPKVIVAIGGCDENVINREIVRLTNKKKPKALFIPTATSDSFDYIVWFQRRFGDDLGCETEVMCLLADDLSKAEMKRMIESADIIYVGGGNTLKMMRRWRFLGVDKLLKVAYNRGAVMCGVSAGAICWFDAGHSDSMSYYNPKKWNYIKVKGLGLQPFTFCPHYDSETLGIKREQSFLKMMKKTSGIGLAADDYAAICFVDDKYKILSIKGAKGHRVLRRSGKLETRELAKSTELKPISDLLNK